MRWYGWIAVTLSWMLAAVLFVVSAMELLPPQRSSPHRNVTLSAAAKAP
jgi:hypothetical protein